MTLADFETLALAKAHKLITYQPISGNWARQFFGLYGILDVLEENKNNVTAITVIPNNPTSIGAICRTILGTIEQGVFIGDPNTADGQANLAASAVLVASGIYTQPTAEKFWLKARVETTPFINSTKNDFDLAKGTINKTKLLTAQNYVKFNTSADVEKHSPRIYVLITFADGTSEYEFIAGVRDVEKAGRYSVKCPNHAEVWIDDAYNVIS